MANPKRQTSFTNETPKMSIATSSLSASGGRLRRRGSALRALLNLSHQADTGWQKSQWRHGVTPRRVRPHEQHLKWGIPSIIDGGRRVP